MPHLVTALTLNPALDVADDAARVVPIHKLRTTNVTHDPGGGGINVARVIHELGGSVRAILLSGGVIGAYIEDLLRRQGLDVRSVPIGGTSRISMTVHDQATGQEYRFVPAGPAISDAERDACLAALRDDRAPWLVASGSLPPGLAPSFYADIVTGAVGRGQLVVLDTSGPALRAALGLGLALIKPSLEEFEALIGCKLPDQVAQDGAARRLVAEGAAARIAVSLGSNGAVLATADGVWRTPALPIQALGAVGAGDSFVAAMVLALARNAGPAEALAWGSAAGAAAVSATGTAHPARALMEALFAQALSITTQSR